MLSLLRHTELVVKDAEGLRSQVFAHSEASLDLPLLAFDCLLEFDLALG